MTIYYKEYKIHTEKGMHDFMDSIGRLFGPKIDTMWDTVCSAPVIKNTRPQIDCTLTEHTIYSENNLIIYPIENENKSYVFHKFTVSLSNPNYIPIKHPDYFMRKDLKPCTAIIIYEDADLMLNSELARPKPETWFGQFIDEFRSVFVGHTKTKV